MKRFWALIFAMVMTLSLFGCGTYQQPEQEANTMYTMTFIESKNVVMVDEPYLGLFFDFTNNTGKTVKPEDLVTVEAFQNGAELTMITFPGQKIEGAIACEMSIQNGTTARVVWLFRRDDNSTVSVEVSDGEKFTVN